MPAPEKILKEEKKPEREFNIHIRLNPKRLLKGLFLLILLVGAFFAGRFTVGPGSAEAEVQEAESSFFSWGRLFGGSDAADSPTAAVVQEVELSADEPVANTTEAATEGSTTEEAAASSEEGTTEEEAATEANNEPIITSYSRVALSLSGVQNEVKEEGLWGKINKITYTIKNNEEGTIKPGYLTMIVEGYNEEGDRRKINLAPDTTTVRAGQTVSATVSVPPKGFTYHRNTAGNLENVHLTIILFDETSKPMANFGKEFNLN